MGEQETFGSSMTSVSRLSEVLNNLTAPLDRITKLIRQRHKSIQDGTSSFYLFFYFFYFFIFKLEISLCYEYKNIYLLIYSWLVLTDFDILLI